MTVGVVGLGMIGGSVGLALRQPGREVIGFDPAGPNAALAMERQCADRVAPLDEVAAADVVFVAVPPKFVEGVLDQIAAHRPEQTVVTDCTSVKAEVVAWADRTGADWFVGGHPMAGHEKTGPAYASSWMFRNARWLLTPTAKTLRCAVKAVESLVKEMGAVPIRCDAADHDRQIAVLSHLPHAFAAVLVTLGEDLPRPDAAGGSWRDLTRVGGVDPTLWTQILMGNRREVEKLLGETEVQLGELRAALGANDADKVFQFFARARTAKRKLEK